MVGLLEKAERQFDDGKLKAAVSTLRYVEAGLRSGGDVDSLRGAISLARRIRDASGGGVQRDCTDVLQDLQRHLEYCEEGLPALVRTALASVPNCRLIGGAGISAQPDATRAWTLAFTETQVLLVPTPLVEPDIVDIGWAGLDVEISGAGLVSSGGGFIGGGFDLIGMAAGMLTAAALNGLTSRTGIETIIRLQTPAAEIYLYYGDVVPEALRRALSPVFLRLRQGSGGDAHDQAGSRIDRLHKLSELLDRGLIDQDEFLALKRGLLQ